MEDLKKYRTFGYDLIINTFEPFLREYIKKEILHKYFKDTWKNQIPSYVIRFIGEYRNLNYNEIIDINLFFEEIGISQLCGIVLKRENFIAADGFIGDLSRSKFSRLMKRINQMRIKIAHAKSSYSKIDFSKTLLIFKELCIGPKSQYIVDYIADKKYVAAKSIPPDFFEEYDCQNNLPQEDYDLEGGFVGREKEIEDLITLIQSDQDRIITITGAGGAGKTAIALKIAYYFLESEEQLFEAIIWFSAKSSKLTDEGISPLDSQISSYKQLVEDILKLLDFSIHDVFIKDGIPVNYWVNHLYNIFSSQKCLLIIDNLETIYSEAEIIDLLKNIPRPSIGLITSRKGLGEIEKRYGIGDLTENDAVELFNLVSKARNREDLVNLEFDEKLKLVNRVKRYPLLIKWSIGQVCLGRNIYDAFSEEIEGDSVIAQFSFNDVFNLLSEQAKKVLYSMIIYGSNPITKYLIQHLTNISDDEFDSAIKELTISSLVFSEIYSVEAQLRNVYKILSLTRGFIESKLDADKRTRINLLSRFHDLSEQIKELEKSETDYTQTFFKLGVKTPEEKIAVNHVKTGKQEIKNKDYDKAEEHFSQALKIGPNLGYVYTEYSKFEYYQNNHINIALNYAKKATEVDPNNYHTWWNYGVLLKKEKMYDEAMPTLKKAKELNKDYLPNYSELGEIYSEIGDYEAAEQEFIIALSEEKFPNYRHKMYTLQHRAINYQSWAESFLKRGDYYHQIEYLKKALQTIEEALSINESHGGLVKTFRLICLKLGKAMGFQLEKGFEEYFLKALNEIKFDFYTNKASRNLKSEGFYYFAFLGQRNGVKRENLIQYIQKAKQNSNKESKYYKKIVMLEKSIKIK